MRPRRVTRALTAVAWLSACAPPESGERAPTYETVGTDPGTATGSIGDPIEPGSSGGDRTSSGGAETSASTTGADLPEIDCDPDEDPFDPDVMRAHLTLLAHDALAGRRPGTPGDEAARDYLEDRFACMGLASTQLPFVNHLDAATANVMAIVPGIDPVLSREIIVIGAHHDGLGVKGGKIRNGANDNGSGTIAMLAVAQSILERPVRPRRTLVFVAFGSEEFNLYGSYEFVEHPPEQVPIDDVVYMLDLDMVGTYTENGGLDAYGSLEGTPARVVLDELLAALPDLHVYTGYRATEGDSDFDAFCEMGIPYLYFETFDEECWHRPCDDADRVDYAHLSIITRLAFDVLVRLADDDTDLAAAKTQFGCQL